MQEAFLLYPDTHSPREHFDDRFRIIDETKDSREIFMRLQENLGSAWDTYYEAAKQWYEEMAISRYQRAMSLSQDSHWEHG